MRNAVRGRPGSYCIVVPPRWEQGPLDLDFSFSYGFGNTPEVRVKLTDAELNDLDQVMANQVRAEAKPRVAST